MVTTFKILILVNPLSLNMLNSSFSAKLMKKSCADIKKIKGRISNTIEGALRTERYKGYTGFKFNFSTKDNSSKRLLITIKKKKTPRIFIKLLINSLKIYFLYVNIIYVVFGTFILIIKKL